MDAAVYHAPGDVTDWPSARAALLEAFAVSQAAAREGRAIVYVVDSRDLLGQRGAPAAMVATGLLSAARTAAIELLRDGTPVNVVAVGDDTQPELVERWISHLSLPGGPTGEVIHLDAVHLGKALP